MNDNNVRIAYIGRTHELPSEVQEKMRWAAEATAHNDGTVFTLALNYGARSNWWMPSAPWLAKPRQKCLPGTVSGEDVHGHLYTAHMPDPDLVVRTSGEFRVSNFLLWQIAYSEIYVTERLWPDFRGIHLLEAIADYQRRERRYGGLNKRQESDEAPIPDSFLVPR